MPSAAGPAAWVKNVLRRSLTRKNVAIKTLHKQETAQGHALVAQHHAPALQRGFGAALGAAANCGHWASAAALLTEMEAATRLGWLTDLGSVFTVYAAAWGFQHTVFLVLRAF